MNRYQIVTNNARSSDRFESADPVTSFAARGFKFTKMEAREYLRDELQGQPKFEDFAARCGAAPTAMTNRLSDTKTGPATKF